MLSQLSIIQTIFEKVLCYNFLAEPNL